MSHDEMDRAMAIGHENEELISLGKGWCTNIRTDRTGMGVGMLEEMTGVPITGGRFTCDFAGQLGGISAMQLAASAVDFYESNCKGCSHRAPGGRIPNLGTWAEGLIAEQERRSAAAEAEAAETLAERQARAAHRTMVASSFDAAGQGIVALINRIDIDPLDSEAVNALGQQADLIPEAFSVELRNMILLDAQELKSSDLLGVCVRLALKDGGTADAGLRAVSVRAAVDGWARRHAAAYLAVHADPSDVSSGLIRSLVLVAAGEHAWPGHSSPGHPQALIRYHALAPQAVEDEVAAGLRHGKESRRSASARSLRRIALVEPDSGLRLLAALLDGLKYEDDDHYGGDRGSDEIAHVVADLLYHSSDVVDQAVSARWSSASEGYRTRLIRCYDAAVRARRDAVTPDVSRVVLARAVAALGDLPSASRLALDEDYQGRASDLLRMAASDAPAGAIEPDLVIGTLLVWIERERAHEASQPQSPMEAMAKMGNGARIGGVVRDIAAAVAAVGGHDVAAFLASCDAIYKGSNIEAAVRSEIVTIAGTAAASSGPAIGSALPLIYSAMFNDSQFVRAAGMEAAESVMRALGPESTPPLLARAAVAGLTDQYLIVVTAAVKACRYIPTDLESSSGTAINLVLVAKAYAADRLRHQLVEDALSAAIRISRDDAGLSKIVKRASLQVIDEMDRYNARESLRHFSTLARDSEWTSVAIRALRADQDPQYETFGDDDKDALLRELARRPLSADELRDLTAGEIDAAKWDRRRAVRAAEALAELGRPDMSVEVLQAQLDTIPDTVSMQPRRSSVRGLLLRFELEAAIAGANCERRREIVSEISALGDLGDELDA